MWSSYQNYRLIGTGIACVIAIFVGLVHSGHFISASDSEKLVESATAKLEKNPRDVSAYQLRAQAFFNLKALPQARQDLEAALKVDPNNPNVCYQLAGVLEPSDKALAKEYRQRGDQLRMSGYRAEGFYKPADSNFWWIVGLLMLVPVALVFLSGQSRDNEDPDDYSVAIPTPHKW